MLSVVLFLVYFHPSFSALLRLNLGLSDHPRFYLLVYFHPSLSALLRVLGGSIHFSKKSAFISG